MKTLKIFLASSSELKDDRDQFRIFLSVENDRMSKKGFYLELVQWEYFLDAVSDTRLQDEYNKAISECDIMLCLFFSRVGKYTQEEFEFAFNLFKKSGKPKIFTYFKDAKIDMSKIDDQIMSLLAFKKRLHEIGHFPSHYKNIEDLKYQFKLQLEKLLEDIEVEQELKDSNPSQIYLNNGDYVAGNQTKIGRQINMGNGSTYYENSDKG